MDYQTWCIILDSHIGAEIGNLGFWHLYAAGPAIWKTAFLLDEKKAMRQS